LWGRKIENFSYMEISKKKKLFTTDESALNMQVEEDKSQT
jgi:hypothetical protein